MVVFVSRKVDRRKKNGILLKDCSLGIRFNMALEPRTYICVDCSLGIRFTFVSHPLLAVDDLIYPTNTQSLSLSLL